ncbi:hypothetical protein SDC9_92813 [bioreactor metagenome]|uniref:Uncharacterized protein n=1 Tax=bioreactor metagenome TaxID=1076179 RepID=A0A644ZYT4_9ZZZZ
MICILIIEAWLHCVVHVFLSHVVNLVLYLLVRPFRMLFTIEAREEMLLHLILINRSLKIHLETKNISVGYCLTYRIGMEQLPKNVFGSETLSRFVKGWRTSVAYPRSVLESLLDSTERVTAC